MGRDRASKAAYEALSPEQKSALLETLGPHIIEGLKVTAAAKWSAVRIANTSDTALQAVLDLTDKYAHLDWPTAVEKIRGENHETFWEEVQKMQHYCFFVSFFLGQMVAKCGWTLEANQQEAVQEIRDYFPAFCARHNLDPNAGAEMVLTGVFLSHPDILPKWKTGDH